MEVKRLLGKITDLLVKYKYAVCILLVGIVLMLLPTGPSADPGQEEPISAEAAELSVEEQLSALLSKIQGAGKVEVMLSCASGAETNYYADRETDDGSQRDSAVIVTDADRNEAALVTRVDPPVYLGAIVLCQGADSAAIRLAIVEAVSKYTGLGADQIAVLKMK